MVRRCVRIAVTAGALLGVLSGAGCTAQSATSQTATSQSVVASAASAASGSGGQQLWVARYSDGGGTAVAVGPAGNAVFVTGSATIRFDAATGARRWVSRYKGPATISSGFRAVTVSPDGSRVFVTGETWNALNLPEYVTIAYDASTGSQLWASLHAGQAASGGLAAAEAWSIVVSPDGKVVYVTGQSGHASAGGRIKRGVYDYVTIAYDAATGKALWTSHFDNGGNDQGRAIAISPSGDVVYVTGRSFAKNTGYDYATIAYNAATGRKLWVARYNGRASMNEFAYAITVAPDGKRVYITGVSYGRTSRTDFATVSYSAATGRQLWVGRYNGTGNLNDAGTALAVSPDNATVVVTGWSTGTGGKYDIEWATIAYDARTGAPRWTKRYGVIGQGAPDQNIPAGVVMNPRGGTVYVTGSVALFNEEGFYGTVSYSLSTGARKWATSYGGAGPSSEATALAISPDGRTLYVTGYSDTPNAVDSATIAYRT